VRTIVKGALISIIGALLIGASLALSTATVISAANRTHPDGSSLFPSSVKCDNSTVCFTAQNSGTGNAIKGQASSGIGLYGLSSTKDGVYGNSPKGFGVAGQSSSGIGVDGFSTSGTGVSGSSKSATGVTGYAGTSGYGGYFQNTAGGAAVYATSKSNTGVIAYGGGNGPGVIAYGGTTGTGVIAYGQGNGTGVIGYGGTNGYGGYFQNNTSGTDASTTLVAVNEAGSSSNSGWPLAVGTAAGSAIISEFHVDGSGDGFFTGTVTASQYITGIRTRGGDGNVAAFTSESTRASIEDVGTARLTNGEGTVRFDPTLASTIDAGRGYQVFLTPDGDTRGLYVAAKYEAGFVVREAEHGRSSLYFDYRVVAHPYGVSDARLPRLNVKQPTLQPPPAIHPRP
jgi:hypothetical protein